MVACLLPSPVITLVQTWVKEGGAQSRRSMQAKVGDCYPAMRPALILTSLQRLSVYRDFTELEVSLHAFVTVIFYVRQAGLKGLRKKKKSFTAS